MTLVLLLDSTATGGGARAAGGRRAGPCVHTIRITRNCCQERSVPPYQHAVAPQPATFSSGDWTPVRRGHGNYLAKVWLEPHMEQTRATGSSGGGRRRRSIRSHGGSPGLQPGLDTAVDDTLPRGA